MDEPLYCYRHPNRETRVTCSECGRPICEDCMTFAPVGIRCPDHAAHHGAAARTMRRGQTRAALTTGSYVTKALVAANVLVYLVTVAQGGGVNDPGGSLFNNWLLFGPAVANGDWWRLFTAMFLHGSLIHLGMNMLALWWLGSVVEHAVGHWRYLLLYVVSGLAGSAGALIADPAVPTVGASGAIYGLLGALLILEWLQTGSFAGQALMLIVLNLVITLTVPGISLGGHLGGLIGGIVGALVIVRFRRPQEATIAAVVLVAIGVASVAVSYWRIRGYA